MHISPTTKLLFPTPNTPRPTLAEALLSARETKVLQTGPGALVAVPEVFVREFPGQRALIVADTASFHVAGRKLLELMDQAKLTGSAPFIYPDRPLPAEHAFVEKLEAEFRQHSLIPVAVGSGTINDLVKLAAHRAHRPYLCVATAASMDGYTAFGASITYRGAKQTFNCPAPRAVVADTEIICCAPALMTASGYADLQAKITAGADWILADALGVEAIDPRAWSIVQSGLRHALANPEGARAGHESAIVPLVEGLMLGGFAMQWTQSSRPASGAEHQFSHLWDMEHHTHHGEAPPHGFKVGIATLAVAALYEELLRQPVEELDIDRCAARWPDFSEADLHSQFANDDFTATAIEETRAKFISRATLRSQLTQLRSLWPALRGKLQAQLLPYAELKARLKAVGAPSEPEEIGITRERLRQSFRRAQAIRRRFTVLDVAVRTGLLEPSLDVLFGPGGIWEINPDRTLSAITS
jgi:glycerol-1-phosphate dehydrogenase [NAD(P)+]